MKKSTGDRGTIRPGQHSAGASRPRNSDLAYTDDIGSDSLVSGADEPPSTANPLTREAYHDLTCRSECLDHLIGTYAAGAHLDPFHLTGRFYHPDLLKVGIGNFLGTVVSMADVVSSERSLTAYFTDSGHDLLSLNIPWMSIRYISSSLGRVDKCHS